MGPLRLFALPLPSGHSSLWPASYSSLPAHSIRTSLLTYAGRCYFHGQCGGSAWGYYSRVSAARAFSCCFSAVGITFHGKSKLSNNSSKVAPPIAIHRPSSRCTKSCLRLRTKCALKTSHSVTFNTELCSRAWLLVLCSQQR